MREQLGASRCDDIDVTTDESLLETETEKAVRIEEALGLEVPVHGEFERIFRE